MPFGQLTIDLTEIELNEILSTEKGYTAFYDFVLKRLVSPKSRLTMADYKAHVASLEEKNVDDAKSGEGSGFSTNPPTQENADAVEGDGVSDNA